ncbi:MAG: YesL family protein [Clostridia bacterium]|nr:YesL family protein [Clostridia bacterium]
MGFFGNMMNNYFYGKSGKGDYTVQSMPQNRRQLFGTVLKTRWSAMIGVNLLYILCWLPATIWTLMNLAALTANEVIDLEAIQSLASAYLIILIPCILITGPFTAGVTYVMRNWSRDEHSFVLSDFWDAVKGNWKQSLGVSLISGIFPMLAYVAISFYGSIAKSSVLFTVPLVLVIMVFVIWKLAEMVIYTMMVTYELSLMNLIRNSILLTVARLPLAVGIKLATLAVPIIAIVVALIAPGIAIYIIMALSVLDMLLVPALNRPLVASYANAQCEKYLNPRIEGARTNIGLRPEDWDDTEYKPEDDEE